MIDWDDILRKIRAFPPHTQRLRPPCPQARIKEEELRLGQIPIELAEMLRRFNGGELFIDAIPFVTVLGLSLTSETSVSRWYIDRLTSSWRAGAGQPNDWVIAIRNYGGISILGQDSIVSEWDSSQRKMAFDRYPFNEWVEKTLNEGAAYLDEA